MLILHDRQLISQSMQTDVFNVNAIDQDSSMTGLKYSKESQSYSRFSCSGATDYSNLNNQIFFINYRLFFMIVNAFTFSPGSMLQLTSFITKSRSSLYLTE